MSEPYYLFYLGKTVCRFRQNILCSDRLRNYQYYWYNAFLPPTVQPSNGNCNKASYQKHYNVAITRFRYTIAAALDSDLNRCFPTVVLKLSKFAKHKSFKILLPRICSISQRHEVKTFDDKNIMDASKFSRRNVINLHNIMQH